MQGFRITKEALKTHFHYGKWIYLGIALLVVLLGELLLTTTAYHPPAEHKVDIMLVGQYASTEPLQAVADQLVLDAAAIDPVLEQITVTGISYTGDPEVDMYGAMNFQVKLGAQAGDVYILPMHIAQTLVNMGAYADLKPLIDAGLLDGSRALPMRAAEGVEGVNPVPEGVICALSLSDLERLQQPDIAFDNRDACLIIVPSCKNPELAAKVVSRMIAELEK